MWVFLASFPLSLSFLFKLEEIKCPTEKNEVKYSLDAI